VLHRKKFTVPTNAPILSKLQVPQYTEETAGGEKGFPTGGRFGDHPPFGIGVFLNPLNTFSHSSNAPKEYDLMECTSDGVQLMEGCDPMDGDTGQTVEYVGEFIDVNNCVGYGGDTELVGDTRDILEDSILGGVSQDVHITSPNQPMSSEKQPVIFVKQANIKKLVRISQQKKFKKKVEKKSTRGLDPAMLEAYQQYMDSQKYVKPKKPSDTKRIVVSL